MNKNVLTLIFTAIFVSLLIFTSFASIQQPIWEWQGLTQGPDRFWTWATLLDAYFGFITFFVWVAYKETQTLNRVLWFVAIMLLGNMAMSAYVLWQLRKLPDNASPSQLLLRQ
jgi:hypothetical protein